MSSQKRQHWSEPRLPRLKPCAKQKVPRGYPPASQRPTAQSSSYPCSATGAGLPAKTAGLERSISPKRGDRSAGGNVCPRNNIRCIPPRISELHDLDNRSQAPAVSGRRDRPRAVSRQASRVARRTVVGSHCVLGPSREQAHNKFQEAGEHSKAGEWWCAQCGVALHASSVNGVQWRAISQLAIMFKMSVPLLFAMRPAGSSVETLYALVLG